MATWNPRKEPIGKVTRASTPIPVRVGIRPIPTVEPAWYDGEAIAWTRTGVLVAIVTDRRSEHWVKADLVQRLEPEGS